MLCNHGSLQPYDTTSVADSPNETLAFPQGGSAFCVYCGGDVVCDGAEEDSLASRLPACSHSVCGGCIQQYQEDLQRLSEGCEVACPLCKVSLKEDLAVSGKRAIADGSQISLSETGMSTKLSKLLEDIKEHRFSDKWYGPLLLSIIYPEWFVIQTDKHQLSIIFSAWKKTLYIISTLLSKQSLPFVQLDGSLSLSDRREVLSRFEQDTQTNVLLMTLGTGAVGYVTC
jgi:SWI/SNF-related matrix-associated actin-dependent regulator of chromatin subfamily A3